jgi:hypothetical protein
VYHASNVVSLLDIERNMLQGSDTTTYTAHLDTIRVMLNAIVLEDAEFCTVDIKQIYLGTPLDRKKYMRIWVMYFVRAHTVSFDIYFQLGILVRSHSVCRHFVSMDETTIL